MRHLASASPWFLGGEGVKIAFEVGLDWNAWMSENELGKPRKRWGCLQWGVVVGAVAMLAVKFMPRPSYGPITAKALQMKAGSNARQIVSMLMMYASDNNGMYPDHGKDLSKLTSNEVFRTLFQEILVQDESIFSCPFSKFLADKNIGSEPGFEQALMPGENHWMMVAGMRNDSPAHYPLLMESAADASWPPKWKPYSESSVSTLGSTRSRGMAWKKGEIIVIFNDASVQTVKLELKDGLLHLPDSVLKPAGKAPLPELKILNVDD